jgi:hypothetical protein
MGVPCFRSLVLVGSPVTNSYPVELRVSVYGLLTRHNCLVPLLGRKIQNRPSELCVLPRQWLLLSARSEVTRRCPIRGQ